ncbi:uncharacterized protein PV07_01116 [Cladophialophora immunda]|uniref:Uncharacterized protein n=1 Tax=Cladophialophora immunda TaxID=569365 RepID=A0A0D2CT32_9EURO|nr:uncharacterized protein PV07_01116 [Cladophialophora immunda]KIW34333.1 hypothetical protein PV07_01116 [Cladophialophora immunda]
MQLTKGVRLDHLLLAVYSFTAVSTAQSVSTLPSGCYITSSVVYGNTTESSTGTTTEPGQSTISTSSLAPSSSPSNGASSFSSTTAPLSSSSSSSSTLTTTTASSPTSSPFVITVSGIGNKLRARALNYVTFSGDNAYLFPDKDLAAVFVLAVDGQLQTGNASVGTNGNTGTLPLMQFSGSTEPSGYIWSFNGTTLKFGDTTFSAIPDGQLYAVFPGSQPPEGAVQVGMTAEFVDASTSSSSLTSSTSIGSSSIEGTSTLVSTASSTEQQTSETTRQTPGGTSTTNLDSSFVSSTGSSPSSGTTSTTLTTPTETTAASVQSTPITYASTSTLSSLPQSTSTSLVSQYSAQSSSSILSSALQSTTSSSYLSSFSAVTSSTTVSNPFTSSPPSQTTNAETSLTTSLSRTTSVITTGGPSAFSPTSTHSSLASTIASSATPTFSTSASTSRSSSLSSSTTKSTSAVASPTSQPVSNSSSGQGSVTSTLMISSSATITITTSRTSPTSSLTGSRTSTSSVSTTTSSSVSSSTSSSNPVASPYPAKRGLAYRNVTTLQFYPPPSPYISWSYNYYSLPNASDDVGAYPSSQYRFIPLLYNDADSLTSIWAANVNFSIANYGTDAIFGFNEPDANFNGQSANMPVAQSIQGYRNFMQPFAGRVKIGAPAVTNAGGGLAYLAQFLGNATQQNLTVDFLNIHWYASPYNIDYFESYLLQAYNLSLTYFPAAPVPVWVTEFGMDQAGYDQATTVQFLKNASRWMDDQLWLARYAWFGNFAAGYTAAGAPATNMLLNVDGSARGVLGDVWYTYNGTN